MGHLHTYGPVCVRALPCAAAAAADRVLPRCAADTLPSRLLPFNHARAERRAPSLAWPAFAANVQLLPQLNNVADTAGCKSSDGGFFFLLPLLCHKHVWLYLRCYNSMVACCQCAKIVVFHAVNSATRQSFF